MSGAWYLLKTLEGEMVLTVLEYCRDARKELQLLESRIKEAFMYHVDPLLPLSLFIFPNKLSSTGMIAQENKPLEWIYLHHKGYGMPTFLTLLAQLINQARHDVNNYMDLILDVLYYSQLTISFHRTLWIFKLHLQITIDG